MLSTGKLIATICWVRDCDDDVRPMCVSIAPSSLRKVVPVPVGRVEMGPAPPSRFAEAAVLRQNSYTFYWSHNGKLSSFLVHQQFLVALNGRRNDVE